jgi:hypothetical protein
LEGVAPTLADTDCAWLILVASNRAVGTAAHTNLNEWFFIDILMNEVELIAGGVEI